jgi:hypothetical protein
MNSPTVHQPNSSYRITVGTRNRTYPSVSIFAYIGISAPNLGNLGDPDHGFLYSKYCIRMHKYMNPDPDVQRKGPHF